MLDRTLRAQWLNMVLMGTFAFMSMMVEIAGLYGVFSYLTAQRRREFGIRLALGAKTTNVLMLVLKQGLGLARVTPRSEGGAAGGVSQRWNVRLTPR